jgi:hypothetical protein
VKKGQPKHIELAEEEYKEYIDIKEGNIVEFPEGEQFPQNYLYNE